MSTTHINACHNNDSNTNFTFTLDSSSYDNDIGMYAAIVRVDSSGDGDSRAWFNLETADTDGAQFGVMGGYPAGYSRDFSSSSAGGYYNLQTGFGSCASTQKPNQEVAFYDTDKDKYQDSSWDDNALRIQFYNTTTGTNIANNSSVIDDKSRISIRSGTATWLNLTANSGQSASLTFDMAANTGYQLNIQKLREGNDITVEVPTNEIYNKKVCRNEWNITASSSVSAATATVGNTVTWTHTITNSGPDATDRAVTYGYNHTNGWSGSTAAGTVSAGRGTGTAATYTESRSITSADVGKTFCSQAYATPSNNSGSGTVYSTSQCVTIPDWTLTATTYSAVNHANPTSNTIDTSSNALYNNNRKTAYPSHPTFGGHAAGAEDKVYYMVRVIRSSDAAPSAATFKYYPSWAFGSGLIAANSVNSGQTDVSSLCPTGFSYDTSFKRCTKGSSWTDASLASGASGYYTLTTADRLWNNSLPSGTTLNNLKGMDLCYIMSFNRRSLTSAGGNDTTAEYWGNLDGSTENRCSVTVRTPWILEPRVANSLGIGTQNAAVGDTYTITPSVGSSQNNVNGTSHNVSIVQVIGSGSWTPTQGITANLNVAPTAANIASFGSGAASIATLSTVSGLTDANFASGTWNGTALSQTFQDAWYGKKVCYYTVVSNAGGWAYDKTTEYRYSNPVCVKWSKSPQVQLRGADASSGGIWDGTSTAYNGGFLGVSQSDARRGSWSQYGLLGYKGTSATTGNVSFFGSGGWTANYSASNRVNACAVTFANVIGSTTCSTSATGGGLYNGSSLTQTISLPTNAKLTTAAVNALPLAGATPITDAMVDGLASGTYRVNADTHITALTLTSSRQITLVSAGNIYLDGNITTASSTFSDLNQVPILNIIAGGQIIVGTGVTQLFGTYINASASATSGFITCPVSSSSTDMRDGGACNSQLRVNGAVISRTTPALRRTIGSGYSSSSTTTVTTNGETHLESITASELFNYQPNLFLTPYAIRQSSTTGNTWIVTKQTVLPARF
ncbi:hypothetical protein IPL44_02005 [Candidatus Saccharibacteria bacterium]|nr:MAG: hypothetical protein IPL44_02005 [Candidatus Saccharibacteria bacterium]